MIPDKFAFSFSLILTGLVVFLLIYFVSHRLHWNICAKYFFYSHQILVLSDLECDYINAQQCCSRLNIFSIPKIAAHVVVMTFLLFTGHWILFIVNFPFAAYLIYEYWTVPKENIGIFDPAEIYVKKIILLQWSLLKFFFLEPRTN